MPIPLYAAALLAALALSGCHRLSKPDEDFSSRMLALFSKDKAPAIEMPEVAELAKQAQAQRDKLLNHLPKNQWVYIENPPQGTADVQNKNDQDFILSLRLNCKISSQHPAFSLSAADGSIVLKAYDSSSGAVQFLLDNKNYGNPFDPYSTKKIAGFQTALAAAKVIKVFSASKLYSFQNQHAELLNNPASCRESG